MNSVVLAIFMMVVLCLVRMPVAVALITAALAGGLHSGMSIPETINAMNDNLLIGAQVGITYVMIGALAVAIARSGLIDLLACKLLASANQPSASASGGFKLKVLLYGMFIGASVLSQNLVPVHIAFIPVMVPPLLGVFNRLNIDRRAVACVLVCTISISYLLIPLGFGAIFLNDILLANLNATGVDYGLSVTATMVLKAMVLPVSGILCGMVVAVCISYRKLRVYQSTPQQTLAAAPVTPNIKPFQLLMTLLALAIALAGQLFFDSLIAGALLGFITLSFSGIFHWHEQDDIFTQGLRMMMQICVIITIASGFAGVLKATGHIDPLVQASAQAMGDNQMLAAIVMLLVGLLITIGFGDSFASVPILAPIYIPLCINMGFSPMATIALLGASAALGDAGSPASTLTLGASAGLNADGQHDLIKDSIIPTFLHANTGMVIFAWLAAMIL
nr:Na+/H+ antiporter NhaC family protein [Kistimonas asteriae]